MNPFSQGSLCDHCPVSLGQASHPEPEDFLGNRPQFPSGACLGLSLSLHNLPIIGHPAASTAASPLPSLSHSGSKAAIPSAQHTDSSTVVSLLLHWTPDISFLPIAGSSSSPPKGTSVIPAPGMWRQEDCILGQAKDKEGGRESELGDMKKLLISSFFNKLKRGGLETQPSGEVPI